MALPWSTTLSLVLFLLAGAALILALGRHAELARLRVRNGHTHFVRGRLPPGLLGDLRDLLADFPERDAEIRIVLDHGRPRVVAPRLGEARVQQIRNLVGRYTTMQFRTGKRPSRDV